MRKQGIARIAKIAVAVIVVGPLVVTLFGFVVMSLWNWLMPELFGLRAIGFWQALGLVVLSKILFGWHGGPGGSMHQRRRWIERWEQMTPEEREKFRAGMGRCGNAGMPGTETPA